MASRQRLQSQNCDLFGERLVSYPVLDLVMRGCLRLRVLALCLAVRRGSSSRAGGGRAPGPAQRGLKAKQSLGQNFLQDVAIARRIAGSLDDGSEGGCRVIELGPGQGALTGHLLARYPRMTAIEIDERMVAHLQTEQPALVVEQGDLLELNFAEAAAQRGGRLGVISNTPYYLTSPLLFKLLAGVEHVESAVLTTQKEVADKILSPPRSKQYGILSVMLQLFCTPERLFEIPPEAFAPAPKVSSTALRFTPSAIPAGENEPLTLAQRAAILSVLKLTFESRRKMLRVSLRPWLDKELVTAPSSDVLALRPEQCSPHDFLALTRTLFGDDFATGGGGALLEKHHVSKAWRAHKAGWKS